MTIKLALTYIIVFSIILATLIKIAKINNLYDI